MSDIDNPVVSSWINRIQQAESAFVKWEERFGCKKLNDYYEGIQNREDHSYALNLIASTWETKKPGLLFTQPNFQFAPLPAKADFNVEEAMGKATLASDLVNTIVANPDASFAENCSMALLDTGPYFGLVEVGYSANWIRNPNADRPVNVKDYDEMLDPQRKTPEVLPEEEWIYVKRILSERVRIGGDEDWQLDGPGNNWVGYYEFFRNQDLQKREDSDPSVSPTDPYLRDDGSIDGYSKCWKIWDLRKKTFFILNETLKRIELKEIAFKRLPLFPLRFRLRRKGFYPVPLFYDWRPAQDDYNEARTQLRAHRRRSKRAYQAVENTVDTDEIEKIVNGPDGVIVWVKQKEAISPIQNGPADSSIGTTLQISKDDFNVAAGSSAESRGQADRVTATQANITDRFAGIRSTSERETVAAWLNSIALEILYQAIENYTLPVWINLVSDSATTVGQEAQIVAPQWQLINTEALEGHKFLCHVTAGSTSPIQNEEEKVKLMEFLAVLNQYPVLSMHPTVIREVAFRLNYRNEQVIKSLQQMALIQYMSMIAQAGGGMAETGAQPTNMDQTTVEQMTPPNQAQLENQLAQVGVQQ
jgi:hypothetical protein